MFHAIVIKIVLNDAINTLIVIAHQSVAHSCNKVISIELKLAILLLQKKKERKNSSFPYFH
jgi:hypothetical protein